MSQRIYTYLVKEDILLLKRRYTAFLRKAHRTFKHSGMGGLMLLSLWLTACVGEELQKPLLGEGEGYLRLQVAPVSAEISTSPLTKAVIPNEQIPKPNQCAIKITNKSTGKSTSYANSDVLPNPLVLKAGVTYTVEAYYGTDSTLQVKPYFHKREDVTVKANQSNDVTLNVSLANAMLVPEVDANLAKHYSTWKLTASTSDKSITFAEKNKTSTSQKTLYAKAEETVTFTFSGTNLAEKEVSSSWDKTFEAGFAYQLQCNPNIDAFKSIEVTATATHTEDNSGNLNGTDITFSAVPNGADLDAIASWQVDVHYNNQIIRTYTGESLSNMNYTDTGWPYIPQGSTLSASVTLKAKDKITLTNASFTSLPAPDFEVSVSAQTSYSVYTKSGAAAANEKDGSSIFNIGSTVKISDEILTNSNYANILPKVTYTTDTSKSSGELAYNASVGDFTGLAWQKHVLTATATFDGATAYASIDCHVTGLPYSAKPPKEAEWSGSHVTWNSNYVEFRKMTNEQEIKKSFYVPESINIYLYHKMELYGGAKGTTYSLSVSGYSLYSKKSEYTKTITNDTSYETTLNAINPTVICHNTYGNPGGTNAKLYIIELKYR